MREDRGEDQLALARQQPHEAGVLPGDRGLRQSREAHRLPPRPRLTVGWSFRKSLKIAPDVRVTLGKRGASVSGGPKGAKLSVNTRSEKRAPLGRFGPLGKKL